MSVVLQVAVKALLEGIGEMIDPVSSQQLRRERERRCLPRRGRLVTKRQKLPI
jgi:hypothetical protein